MNNKIIAVIPTYNARAGIVKPITRILEIQEDAKIIVVDDNSPDTTADLIREKFAQDKRVVFIVRKGKGGQGSAVITGFKEGLKDENVHLFFEMDADLVHDPNDISKMIEKSKECDIVVDSRYLLSSQITKWSFKREDIFSCKK